MKKKRFKTKVKATDRSHVIPDQTIGEVIKAKIEFVINQTRKQEPHITWLSKYALIWGGRVFNDLEYDNPLRIGFVGSYDYKAKRYKLSHLPGRMPTESEQERMEKLYGVCLPWPPRGLSDVIQSAFREIEDKLIENSDSIIMAPCRGYIDRNGLLIDPAWNRTEEWTANMVSGYLIYRDDPTGLSVVQKYLMGSTCPLIMKRQVERTKLTAPQLRQSRITAANSASIRGDRRLQRIKSLIALETNEQVDDWSNLLSIEASNEESDNDE